ncbi:DUF6882 domain-containing protein [Phenylobacterium sp.]|uniref:DUF6882 domain-containing protein n=1 Tax=Phenylobacterium sp. TaxID=1871053 RepID=UPI00301E30AD
MTRRRDPFGPREPEATLARSMAALQEKTRSNMAWGLGSTERWNVSLESGLITFSGDGRIVSAAVQVIGTYSSEDGTWLWGWDHPSVLPELARDAELARRFGEEHGLSDYTRRKVECDEQAAWQFTAVACHLAGATGAYRGPSGSTYVFMTFGPVTIGRLT